jgi:hypothetical protein
MGDTAAILEPPADEATAPPVPAEETAPEEVPSVFSVTNRYLVGAAEVSDPAEDGSQIIRLASASGGAVIEANLSPQLCGFIKGKLGAVKVVSEDDEEQVVEEDEGNAPESP